MTTAYLGLGSNLGDRRAHLQAAVDGMSEHDDVRPRAVSPVYETEAHTKTPREHQPPFLNAVLEIDVEVAPETLLRVAQALEDEQGRERGDTSDWQPRPLDIDLLTVGSIVRRTEPLTLPHPRLGDRRFVLRPWADLAPNLFVPPPFEASVQTLLEECRDSARVVRTSHVLTLGEEASSMAGRHEEGASDG